MPAKPVKRAMFRPRRLGLRHLIIAAGALVVVMALVAAALLAGWQSASSAATEQRARLLMSARHLALASGPALAGPTPALVLQPFVGTLQKEDPSLVYAVVVNARGEIKGHVDPRRVGERFAAPEPARPLAAGQVLRPGETLGEGPSLLLAESPVLDREGARLGRALVGFDRQALAARARTALVERLLMLGLLLMLIVGGLGLALRRLLAPLARLRAGLDQLDRKPVELALPAGGCRELIELLEAFNGLGARLAEQRAPQAEPASAAGSAPAAAGAAGAASANAAGPSAAEREILRRLARAQKEGKRLQLPASIEALGELRGWVRASLEQAGLPSAQTSNLVDTVHARAAGLAEEAYELDPRQRIELWWLGPAATTGSEHGASSGDDCCFILREKGKPGPARKGYCPGTEAGNLTLIPVTLMPQPAPEFPR